MLIPINLFDSTWLVQYQAGIGVSGLCTATDTAGWRCSIEDSNASGQISIKIPGPINKINVLVQNGGGWSDVQFGYIDKDGKQEYTGWALADSTVAPDLQNYDYNNSELAAQGYKIL